MSSFTLNPLSNKNKNNKNKNEIKCTEQTSYASDLDIMEHKLERTLTFDYTSPKEASKAYKSIRDNYKLQAGVGDIFSLIKHDSRMAPYLKGDYFVKLIEDIFILFHTLSKSITKKDYLMSITIFVKLRCMNSSLINTIYEKFMSILDTRIPEDKEYQLQSFEPVLKDLRFYLDSYSSVKNTEVYKKVYRCVMFLLSMSFFEKVGITLDSMDYTRLEKEALRKKYHMGADFIHCMLDTSLFLIERGYQYVKTGKLSSIFHGEKAYEKFFDETLIIKKQSQLLNEPELHGFSEPDFLERLDCLIEQGKNITKYTNNMSDTDSKFVKSITNDMEMIKNNLMSKSRARDTRKTPFALLIFGDSSIGKSSLVDMIYHHYGKLKNLPTDAKYKYVRNPIAKYWDGFKTSQWCTVIDDIAFLKPNASPAGDPSTLEVIQIINPTPFVPDQAALEDKGRIPFRGELVIATTNTENLNAYHYFSCPSAVQRRLPYIIDVRPKDEYKTDSGMLDSSLVNEEFGDYPDLWVYTVKKVNPTSARLSVRLNADIETIHENIDLHDFLSWLNKAIAQHDCNQEKVQNSLDKLKSVVLCGTCKLPPSVCRCNFQTQSEITEYVYASFLGLLIPFCFRLTQIAIEWLINYILYFLYISYIQWPLSRFFLELMWKTGAIKYYANHKRTKYIRKIKDQVDKIRFSRIGSRIQKSIGYPWFFTFLAGGIVTFGVLYKMYRIHSSVGDEDKPVGKPLEIKVNMRSDRDSDDESLFSDDSCPDHLNPERLKKYTKHAGISNDIGSSPEPTSKQRENVWYKNDFQLTSFDVSTKTTGFNGLSHKAICDLLLKNCYSARLIGKRSYMSTKMFCIGGRIFLINKHSLENMDDIFDLELVAQSHKDGVTRNRRFPVNKSSFVCDDTDIALISLPLMDAHKDYTSLFASDTFQSTQNGYLLCRFENGEDDVQPFWRAHYFGGFTCPQWEKPIAVWEGLTDKPTIKGMCGSIFVCMSGLGPVILGMHFLGYDNRAVSLAITRSYLENRLQHFDEPIIQCGTPELSSVTATMTLGDLNKKSPLRYISEGHANVYGSFIGFRASPKSSVEPSPLSEELRPHGYEIRYGAPVMTGWEPKRKALIEMVNTVERMDENILKECSNSFLNDILKSIPQGELKQCMVYDNFTAVNGCAGISYVDKMNRNTSAGNPWKKSKKFFMKSISARGENLDPVEFDSEIMDRVDIIIEKYRRGERAHPNFCAHLKDEAVSFKKIKECKTRVFTGAPVDWSIVVRKFFLSSIRLLQNNRFVFEAAPGTIAQSLEWEEIYKYLVQHGENKIVAGDYGNYDKAMMSTVILQAFKILIKVNEASENFSPEDIKIMYGIAEDTAFPLIDFFGDLVGFYGSNPSGHPLTVIINSLVNSLYMRYVYVKLSPAHSCALFKNHVSLMTYGDDNIMGISDDAPWFNHTVIQEEFAKVGIVYTMADKEAKSVPYINISQASFLKRIWRYDSDIGAFVCPLDHNSIEKMLMIWVKSKTISNQEQMCAIVASAVREYFWYGKEIFHEKSEMLKKALHNIGYERWIEPSTFPEWTQLREEFWRASQHLGV